MKLNHDFEDLRRRLRRLQTAKVERRIDLVGTEAMAECAYRLALHPSAPDGERVGLLAFAHLHAATNPKYAYHMGLLFLKRGQLDRAALWLEDAARRSPNSHRIWVHVSLLQSQLNDRYAGDRKYEKNSLRDLSSEVQRNVTEGADRFSTELIVFEPRRSAAKARGGSRDRRSSAGDRVNNSTDGEALPYARRLVDEGRCRWPSVYELALEDALQAELTQRSLERASPLMDHTVRTAAGRRGGAAAFAIAAIQWLAAGYPAEKVARWRATLNPGDKEPALDLVDRTLELYEAPVEDVATLLRQALSDGAIPLYLGTLIHYQRLMAPRLPRFSEHTAFQLARTNSRDHRPDEDETIDAEAAEIRRRLEGGFRKLREVREVPSSGRRSLPSDPVELAIEERFSRLRGNAVLLAGACEETSSHAQQLMTLAAGDELTEAAQERLMGEGRHVVSIHRQMQGVAENVSNEVDSYLAAACLGAERGNGSIEAGQTLRDLLNAVRYSSLRYLEDEIERHSTNGKQAASSQVPPPPALQSLEDKLSALEHCRADQELKEIAASVESFLEVERIAPRLVVLQDQLWDELKAARKEAKAVAAPAEAGLVQRRKAEIEKGVERCDRGAKESLRTLNAATEEISRLPPAAVEEQIGADYPLRRDKTKKQLSKAGALGKCKKALKKINSALDKYPDRAGAASNTLPGEAGRIAAEIEELLAGLGPAGEAAADRRSPEPAVAGGDAPGAEPATLAAPLEATDSMSNGGEDAAGSPPLGEVPLRQLLADIVAVLSGAYAECRRSLEASLGCHHKTAEYRALMAVVDSREAEMLHGLGLRRRARRIWGRMSLPQPSHVGLLKNIAVCASYDPDRAQRLGAWRRYLEALYYYDAVLAKPNLFAPERKQLHEGIGMALLPQSLPRFFYEQEGKIDPDEQSRVSLVEQHGQMRQFVAQVTLMFFNAKVDFRSPLLFLGVDRGESPDVRTAAAGQLRRLCDTLAGEIGWPVFALYLDRVRDHVEDQLEVCRDPTNLTHRRDPHFPSEKPRQLEWLREACLFKIRLRNLLLAGDLAYLDHVSWPAMIRFIDAMARLDEMPIDLSPSFLNDVVLELRTPVEQLIHAAGILGALLIQQKFSREPLSESGNLSESQYRQMLEAWSDSGLAGREVPVSGMFDYRRLEAFLDDPGVLYHDQAQSIVENATGYDEGIDFLESWGAKYGGITGPTRQAAQLIARNGDPDRAYELLASCIETARFPAGRDECRRLMKTLKAHEQVEEEEYVKALPTLKERVEEDEGGDVAALEQYLRVFALHSLDRGKDPGHEEMKKTVDAWLGLFSDALGSQEMAQVLQLRDQALIVAFTAHLGDVSAGGVDPRSEREALSHLIERYPEVTEAYVWRMRASYRIVEKELERERESSARKALEGVRQDARYIRDRATDADRRKLAERYLEDAEQLFAS